MRQATTNLHPLSPPLFSEEAAPALYDLLMGGRDPDEAEHFDAHILACILALAIQEAEDANQPLSATSGLEPAELQGVLEPMFPHAPGILARFPDAAVSRGADEDCLVDLLRRCSTDGSPFQRLLAAMVARRAQSSDHLWQDLGLRNRGELSRLMLRHFRPLAARNPSDMKWKKFLYRMICRDAGYSICTAPSCSECIDFENCFGDETGESRLARVRRASDLDGGG